jgi:adenosylmethionine-8-amino-7-oxononanoate aminotransferase
MGKNQEFQQRDERCLWHPFTQVGLDAPPVPVASASGAVLVDEEGSEYIDAICSWWAALHGHNHPHITAGISEQLQRLHHVMFSGFTHEPGITLAERLIGHFSGYQKVFLSDNGSTACEVGLKMAIQLWFNRGEERKRVIALEEAYHGDTFGTMSVGGEDAFVRPFSSHLFPVDRIPAPVAGCEEKSLALLRQLLETGEISAFIFEPLIQGAGGMRFYSEAVLEEMISLCRKHGVVSIADEVMTGFGRTGADFVSTSLNESPDIVCLSKGLTGGALAMGATVTTGEVFDAFVDSNRLRAFLHGHTFTGNPLACSAALASLDLFESEESREMRRAIEAQHKEFAGRISGHPCAHNVRSKGVVLALEIGPGESSEGYLSGVRDRLLSFFMEQKVLLRPLGSTVYVLPPYCISVSQLDRVYSAIEGALDVASDW